MQNAHNFSLDIHRNISEENLGNIDFQLGKGDIVFFSGDLGAGKTTFIRSILRKHFDDESITVRSPTYTYYQKYTRSGKVPVFHFDLYRLESVTDIYLIGAEEHLRDSDSISLIEWPDILGDMIIPTKKISITPENDGTRTIEIIRYQHSATE